MLDVSQIDHSWSLFLDRDGVINEEKEDSYIFSPDEFVMYAGAAEAIAKFSSRFGSVFLVTNQRGIGKGLMTEDDLARIHAKMQQMIAEKGGHFTKIYFAPELDRNSPRRKPNPGMAWEAKKDFPNIDFDKSIMIGNRLSDMEFGRNAGMHTVFLSTTNPETPFPHPMIDMRSTSLKDFADRIK